jgi:hypothetical protein
VVVVTQKDLEALSAVLRRMAKRMEEHTALMRRAETLNTHPKMHLWWVACGQSVFQCGLIGMQRTQPGT